MLVGSVSVCDLGAEAGFSQVSVMNTAFGVCVAIVSQISVACLESDRALIRVH